QLKLRFLDASGTEIKSFTSKGADEGEKKDAGDHGGGDDPKPTTKVGLNRFNWNARYPDATNVPGTVMWAGSVTGPLAPPGRYTVELTVNGETHSASFNFVKDPRTAATQADLDAQFALLRQIRDKLSETHDTVLSIRAIRQQVDNWVERTKGSEQAEAIAAKAKALRDALTEIENELTQTRSKAHEDPLNFPIQLNNKLAALAGVVASADAAPTEGSRGVFTDLSTRVDLQLGQLREILASELADFNAAVRETELPPVVIPPAH
ncbi:MAG: glycosyl hydrolase, partial [Chloroflexia bacterium]